VLPILIGLLAAGLACFLYASLVERNWFVLRRHRVECLPAGARPLRVLHISDLHFRRRQRRKAEFLAHAAGTNPDLVVSTGDFLDESHSVDFTVEAVTCLKPAAGALFVLGSHDYYPSRPSNPFKYLRGPSDHRTMRNRKQNPWPDLVAGLEARGWTMVLNRATRVEVEGFGSIDVVGLDDPHLLRHDLTVASPRNGDGFRLAIVHSPDAAQALADLDYDLIVCGHTHGGQLRIPGVGAIVTNCTLPRAQARGVSRMGNAWLHVSAGLGTSAYSPFRFACRPEVCLLELVPKKDGATART
jgi:predicted MPP superfamily phosphohydrolase